MGRWLAPLLAGTLLGAVAGGAIVMLCLDDGASGEGPLTVSAKAAEPGAAYESRAPAPAVAEASDAVAAERSAGSLGATNAPPELLDRIASITRRAPASGRRGDKTIKGRVTDARARPLAGVLVRAQRE